MPTWLKEAIAWFEAPVKTMLIFAVISGLAIFTPYNIQAWAGTYGWTMEHRVLEWGFMLAGVVFVLLSALERLWEIGMTWMHINHLPKDERAVLNYYVTNKIRTHFWGFSDAAAGTLCADGILVDLSSRNRDQQQGVYCYQLKGWIFRYLVKHPSLTT